MLQAEVMLLAQKVVVSLQDKAPQSRVVVVLLGQSQVWAEWE
jgi:hypothetical protein